MIQNYSYQFRIYPTKEQKNFLAKEFGAARKVYNLFLEKAIKEYQENKTYFNYNKAASQLKNLKKIDEFPYLKESNAQSLQFALKCLETAFKNLREGNAKYPTFHKRSNDQCIKIPQHFNIEDNKLFIPKLKSSIKINIDRPIEGRIICIFISKSPSNIYNVSVSVERDIASLPPNKNIIGIDLGLIDLITTSDNEIIPNQKNLKKNEKKLKFKQRQHSKKQKGSKRKEKARIELAETFQYISNCRLDHLHKATKHLIDNNQVIIAESLRVVNMMKNHNLARSIGDASWGEIIRQLKYKSIWYGRTFYQIDTFFPSSKTCFNCKEINNDLVLKDREWKCPCCYFNNKRDFTAALNIRNEGIINLLNLDQSPLKDFDLSVFGIKMDIKQKLGEALTSDIKVDNSNIKDANVKLGL
jgi:putative transposase